MIAEYGPGLGDTTSEIAQVNQTNMAASAALAQLAAQVIAYLQGKGYVAGAARTAGVSNMFTTTDRYDAYISNVPAYKDYTYYISASDLGTPASQIAQSMLSSFEWKAMYAQSPIAYPSVQEVTGVQPTTTAAAITPSVIPGSGKPTTTDQIVKEAGEMSGGATWDIEAIYNDWITGAGKYAAAGGVFTGVMEQQLDQMYKARNPAATTAPTTSVVPAANTPSITNITNGNTAVATVQDFQYYKDMMLAEDIIPGVANWMILAGAAAALYFMNKSGGR